MQKYRADLSQPQPDGAIVWRSIWMGGRPLAKIVNCRLVTMAGDMRRTVYTTGEADTWFSVPAVVRIMGCRVTGYAIWSSVTRTIEPTFLLTQPPQPGRSRA